MWLCFVVLFTVLFLVSPATAQTLTSSNVQIDWKVVQRFRFFKDPALFKMHETAWRQYRIHVDGQAISEDGKKKLLAQSSVIGTEHVLNDRYIPFTRILRTKYDWRGWAAKGLDQSCWNENEQDHSGCGGIDAYVSPVAHDIEVKLTALQNGLLLSEFNCEWRVDENAPVIVPCDEATDLRVPYPTGGTVSVQLAGEQAVSQFVQVKDLLIAGLGDSFASGEGNPDMPVILDSRRRAGNTRPARLNNDVSGNARWTDQLCHRSLYGHQLRAALQVAIENPRAAVTFLGYACSGATVDNGMLGPQDYVEYKSDGITGDTPSFHALSGGKRDTQLYRLLNDLCTEKLERNDGLWACPGNRFRRNVDFVLLSVGGNDIGFSSLVGWATLRGTASASIAKFFGATVSAKQFGENMRDILPAAYARLAKAIESRIPLKSGDVGFDASRVIITAYPDILVDERGGVCAAGEEDEDEAQYAANQSLDVFSSWLVVTKKRLTSAHEKLADLDRRMAELAEDHGWTFAGRAYGDKAFQGRGFCARNDDRRTDPAEVLRIPCWSKPGTSAQTCESSLSGGDRIWQPYDPGSQNFPYALRQRWVRTFNDVYMVVNQKVLTREGRIDERASASIFSETTGAMHPSAEGHAAMADAMLLDLRRLVGQVVE